ncbi:hypothetical protein ACFQ4C_25650 [Larkinella insperata]|uniref:Uncharacterized protein n=1 Tax=Larkinella insperata TaxID=332158 RepID=A0ABW3QLM5_9BACT|nr:hypothetical protein [Larkinella insperata]
MNYAKINSKRQLLADFFIGRTESLQAYKDKQEQIQSPYRWAVYNTVEAVKYLITLDGTRKPMTDEEFDQVPTVSKFILVDYATGARVSALKELQDNFPPDMFNEVCV